MLKFKLREAKIYYKNKFSAACRRKQQNNFRSVVRLTRAQRVYITIQTDSQTKDIFFYKNI